MRKLYILIGLFLLLTSNIFSQAIRKNYLEMTATEQLNLVNAFYQLRLGPDLINDLANFHGDFFSFESTLDPTGLSIHLNLPDRPQNEIFFAWHRRQMFEVERAMQNIDPNLSMPYWDSENDQSVNSPLWDQNFLGQFNVDWGLGRTLGGQSDALPTSQEVLNVQSNTNFLLYSNAMERGSTHTGAHRWVGGAMASPLSPRDPAFYLHHTNVDRWWAEWQETNQSSFFQRTSMLRYDGTYQFNGIFLPLVNPNDIVNPKVYGTFYAQNQLAVLDNYTVSNTYNTLENFYYQFTIQSGNNFIIPSGNNCKFESEQEIILQPGFEAAIGSNFIAKIDNESNKASISKRSNEIVRNQIPFDLVGELLNVYDQFNIEPEEINLMVLKSFPNPFSDQITIQLNKQVNRTKVIVIDLMGRTLYQKIFKNTSLIELNNLGGLSNGIFILNVLDENNNVLQSKKFVKM